MSYLADRSRLCARVLLLYVATGAYRKSPVRSGSLMNLQREELWKTLTWVYIVPNVMSKREQTLGMKINATNPKMAQIMAKSPTWTTLLAR